VPVADLPSLDVALTTSDGVSLLASFWPGPADAVAFVVCHGFTGSARTPHVQRICLQLAERGAAVLAPDFRGHGRSGGRSTAGALEIHDLIAAVGWLREQGFAKVVVLGWSMGGSVALRHAGLGGDADAVVSVSSPGAWFERGTRSMRVVHWLCETRTGRLVCRFARGTRLEANAWDATVPESPADVAGRIAPRPLLIVHGDADHYFPAHHVELLAAAAPSADVWIEPGMGHAETATTADLVERIARWAEAAVAGSGRPLVCDDDVRD
jgi:pimeloyl-ACP methyl ester carboxylesterase